MILTAGNGIYYLENYEHLPAVAALFITLPRQLQIVQNIFALFDLLLSWQGVRQQLAQLEHTLSLTQVQKDLTQYVQLEQLSFSVDGCTKRYTGVSEVLGALKQTEPRRVTLRGRNASGKSTVLAMLAEATGEESFYLPTNYVDLAFATRGLGDRSDGARMLGVFQEISEITGLRYVLLDEWDANLDKENVALIDATIARLARHKVVVESRHHV
jgi:ABC-type transport system involved in cytochrome bd biosynthesis fused ATPase/permease subunit